MEEDSLVTENIRKTYPMNDYPRILNIFFYWALPLFYQRYKKEITDEEYFEVCQQHESQLLGDRLEKSWNQEIQFNRKPSLLKALWRTFRCEFIVYLLLFLFIEFVLKMSQPLLIGKLMDLFENNQSETIEIYICGFLIFVTSFLNVIIGHNTFYGLQQFGMKMRIACCSLIYRKSLKLNCLALIDNNVGKIVNLLSNDVRRLDMAISFLIQLTIAPIETIVIIFALYKSVGWYSTAGILFLIAFVPIQMYMGRLAAKYRRKAAPKTDERVQLMEQIINGIRIIKIYTWEKPFAKIIKQTRKLEMKHIRLSAYLKAINVSFMIFLNRTGIFLCVFVYVLFQHQIDARYVFIVSAFYANLRQTLTVYIPLGINNVSETKVSIDRIRKYLLSSEIIPLQINSTEDNNHVKTTIRIQMRDVSTKWNDTKFVLKNVNFVAKSNEHVAIIGKVGSGKSTLFQTILNEVPYINGNIEINGTISYSSQEPWLFSGTIRQNILFGQKRDLNKYQKILKLCCLEYDLNMLKYRDNTRVGDNGILLSGGQKARINLARALYKDADIYLFDDPLSSVDVQVGREIFQNCFCDYLKDKCVILITNQLQYLTFTDHIYLIENNILNLIETEKFDSLLKTIKDDEDDDDGLISTIFEKKQEVIKEQRNTGKISNNVYRKYLRAFGGPIVLLLLIIMFILTQLGASGAEYFVGFWVDIEQTGYPDFLDYKICNYFYAAIILFTITICILRSLLFFKSCTTAAINLHDDMLQHILKAPMRFFHDNPSGRILNRFSKDMGSIDETIAGTAMDVFQIIFVVIGYILVITLVNPWMLLPAIIIFIVFYYFRLLFLASSRNFKRMEAITSSPVFSHATATLQALTTIRVCGNQKILKSEFDHHQNVNTSASFMFLSCNRAFGFWLDMICVTFSGVVISTVILQETRAGSVGLAITQAIGMTGILQWGMRQWSELENQMTSVERIVEYTEIPHEYDDVQNKPPKDWPTNGIIEYESVNFRYNPKQKFILTNITFKIDANMKIGIVGRTGAGKTSLISSLIRLGEIDGRILIDNVNIKDISLHDLRSKISIIPQDPVLFAGTLRDNLDPFNVYNDDEILSVLDKVKLKDSLNNDGIYQIIQSNGRNFSIGQRQLICLARAILRKNKILILDEATANVDQYTDQVIQSTIRKQFENCTVLTIAHRINTIIDCDKIMVIDNGCLIEFDHPYQLVLNEDSVFNELVNNTGPEMAKNLINIAENNFKSRNLIR